MYVFCQQRSPLGKACTFGRLEVVNLLLERGAEVKPRALEDALKEGYEYVSCVGVPYSERIFVEQSEANFHRNYFGLPC